MTRIIFIYVSILISIFLIISPSHSHEINRNNIDTIIKDFLKKNPDYVKSTLDNYKIYLEKVQWPTPVVMRQTKMYAQRYQQYNLKLSQKQLILKHTFEQFF